jgi:hypothetical protein
VCVLTHCNTGSLATGGYGTGTDFIKTGHSVTVTQSKSFIPNANPNSNIVQSTAKLIPYSKSFVISENTLLQTTLMHIHNSQINLFRQKLFYLQSFLFVLTINFTKLPLQTLLAQHSITRQLCNAVFLPT